MLKIFIEKREQMKENEQTKKEKDNNEKEKKDINEINSSNKIKEKRNSKNIDNNEEENVEEENKIRSSMTFSFKSKIIIENVESDEIHYSTKKKVPYEDGDFNIFFIMAFEEESLSNLEFATFQKKRERSIPTYINYNSYIKYFLTL